MPRLTRRVLPLTALAMSAFAANSLLCRLALKGTAIDAATFTTIRLASGALALALLVRANVLVGVGGSRASPAGDWPSAFALFAYAAAFSFAYASLPAATGALLLFGAVQATMIIAGLASGEVLSAGQRAGFLLAVAGLVGLLSPGLAAPPLAGSLLMIGAGIAWGYYSLRGRGVGDPSAATAGNFLRATCLTLLASAAAFPSAQLDLSGAALAVASGVLASGLGYVVWYAVLPGLPATHAAAAQLSVPMLAAFGGAVILDEPLSTRLVLASLATLGGIALVIFDRKRERRCQSS
jgi:drug/metabolite transporter (DMT)-like permease